MRTFSRRTFVAASLTGVFWWRSAPAQNTPIAGARVALKGYDPVSYFTEGKPEKGSSQFTFAFDDSTYWFKSAEHRARFVADPERYAPQFAGYCAIQVSRGAKVEADPEAWTIADGKLYVFSAKMGVPMFEQQSASIVEKASENWQALRTAQ